MNLITARKGTGPRSLKAVPYFESPAGRQIDKMDTLPEFTNPPINEVVLGFQYEPPDAYSSIFSGKVWDVFKSEFPFVREVSRLESQFEVFGGNPSPSFDIRFGDAPMHNRLWFTSSDESHLIQFQEDRFFLNWRKNANGSSENSPYPRYEAISAAFKSAIYLLNDFFLENFGHGLKITQSEISYVNIVEVQEFSDVSSIFSFIDTKGLNLEGAVTNFVEVLVDADNRPHARSYYELQSLLASDGRKFARLNLTVRGKPEGDSIESGLSFIDDGRLHIINRFCGLTTREAQKKWGMVE